MLQRLFIRATEISTDQQVKKYEVDAALINERAGVERWDACGKKDIQQRGFASGHPPDY
jgi:hypothetical protein